MTRRTTPDKKADLSRLTEIHVELVKTEAKCDMLREERRQIWQRRKNAGDTSNVALAEASNVSKAAVGQSLK